MEDKKNPFPNYEGYDFNKLVGAQAAYEFLTQGGEGGVESAQRTLVDVLNGIDRYEPYVNGILTKEKNLEDTIKGQLDTYKINKNKSLIGDLVNYDFSLYDSYAKGGSEIIKNEFSDLFGLTYGELNSKKEEMEYIIKGEKHNKSSPEEVESAKKKLMRYQKLMATISLGEQERISSYKIKTEKNNRKNLFNQMYFQNQK